MSTEQNNDTNNKFKVITMSNEDLTYLTNTLESLVSKHSHIVKSCKTLMDNILGDDIMFSESLDIVLKDSKESVKTLNHILAVISTNLARQPVSLNF